MVGTVSTNGGQVTLPAVATVIFPPGAFLQDQPVEVRVTSDTNTAAAFTDTTAIFGADGRAGYEVRIRTGHVQPLTDFAVTFDLPEAFRASVPTNSEIRVFGQNYWEDGTNEVLDTFELFPERFLPTDLMATVLLPKSLFTDQRTGDGTFEAILTLGTTPTRPLNLPTPLIFKVAGLNAGEVAVGNPPDAYTFASQQRNAYVRFLAAAATDTCDGTTLGPPLDGILTVRSPFGPRDPSIGSSDYHYGTDYRASIGTPVKAMHDAVVERVTVQKGGKGWGQYIVLKGAAGRTLYAHLTLDSATVAEGDTVQAGDTIALSGNTGIGTAPHLHVEYAPDGSIFVKDNKVNPQPCIGPNVDGSITVRDNGSLADDAFTVSINGQAVCQTQIGASNTCGVGSLRPGTATLTIVAVIAPDNVGTYEITLAQGLTFAGGGATRSGTIPEGGSASFSITIPAP